MTGRIAPSSFQASEGSLEDPITGELMKMAVTMVPCGHTLNASTVAEILATSKTCPFDRKPIERSVPNYTVRHMVDTNNNPPDVPPTEVAQIYFAKGKALADKGDYEGAIDPLLKALEQSPTFEKAKTFLDFCLQQCSKTAGAETVITPQIQSALNLEKDTFTNLMIRLLDHSSVQANTALVSFLEAQVEELVEQDSSVLSEKQVTIYKWVQKLIVDQKVSDFVAKKLLQMHAQPLSNSPKVIISRPLPSIPVAPPVPDYAFGAEQWKKHFGDVGDEPPLPSNIQEILESPCPFWPQKEVQETHLLVLIPKTVNGRLLNLKFMDELAQKPLKGKATKIVNLNCGNYGDQSVSRSRWILMVSSILPDTEGQSYSDQKKIISKHPSYCMPQVLDVVVSVFTEYARNDNTLFSGQNVTMTRCIEEHHVGSTEKGEKYYLTVGDFRLKTYKPLLGPVKDPGLTVEGIIGEKKGEHQRENIGMAAMRKL